MEPRARTTGAVYRDEAAFELEHKQAPHYFTYRDVSARVVVPGSQVNVSGELFKTFTWIE